MALVARLWKRLLRQPLVQFVLIGAVIFAVYDWRRGDADAAPTQIRVGAAELQWLYDTWQAQFGHRPSAAEMASAIRGHVDEEMRYREGLALGLDRNDTIVRRRLAQKYDFLLGAETAAVVPTEAQLRALFDRNPGRYAAPVLTRFCQTYYGPGPQGLARARAALAAIPAASASDPAAAAGDTGELPYPRCYAPASPADIGRDFGEFFTGVVSRLPPGRWQGPVESGYGFHLVLPQSRTPGATRPFEAVRPAVEADWRRETAAAARARSDAALRERYEVTVDEGALAKLLKGQGG